MRIFHLFEDISATKLKVIFSSKIIHDIYSIRTINQNNLEGLSQWYEYIDRIKKWLSNPSIAWDYANRFTKFPNGARYISDINYNIGYTVKTNQYGAYVYVFMINLNLEEFGLLKENIIQNVHNIMKTKKKVIKLTESDLHNMIAEGVRQALNELDWKTYANAARKRKMQGANVNDVYGLDMAANKALRRKYAKDKDWFDDRVPRINTTFSDRSQFLDYKRGDFGNNHYSRPLRDEFDDDDKNYWEIAPIKDDPSYQDIHDYFSNKSRYVKGKGWQ